MQCGLAKPFSHTHTPKPHHHFPPSTRRRINTNMVMVVLLRGVVIDTWQSWPGSTGSFLLQRLRPYIDQNLIKQAVSLGNDHERLLAASRFLRGCPRHRQGMGQGHSGRYRHPHSGKRRFAPWPGCVEQRMPRWSSLLSVESTASPF